MKTLNLKKYTISQLKIGKKVSITRVINNTFLTESLNYLKDNHPIHTSSEWAKSLGYKKKIIPGFAITSFFSNLIGTKLPGIYCVIMNLNFTFKSPVYVNDKLTFICKISKIHKLFKVVKLELFVIKKNTKVVLGIASCKILK
jgi:3-hydroxybutyryl-CoA dehydratase|tara:strand:+ start:152 stop:580 length:429 start_codon:yes stop_codon:yes gene_type:complete